MVGASAISPECFRWLRGVQGKQTSGILRPVPRSAFCVGLSLHLGMSGVVLQVHSHLTRQEVCLCNWPRSLLARFKL